MPDCNQNIDLLKLLREGTTQDQRFLPALDPANSPIDAHSIADKIVFAKELSSHLVYYSDDNIPFSDWSNFFSRDVSVALAIASIQDLETYKKEVQSLFNFLNNNSNTNAASLKEKLGQLYGVIATVAFQMDGLLRILPAEISLKGSLLQSIRNKLAPALQKLIAFHKEGQSKNLITDTAPSFRILHADAIDMAELLQKGLSNTWFKGHPDWTTYKNSIAATSGAYGTGNTFTKINHLSTHQLFKNVFDEFLRVFAKTIEQAKINLQQTLEAWDTHSPHYALFLSFLQLGEYVREKMNTLTSRHLDFYYRDILHLKENASVPGKVHLLAELAQHAESHLLAKKEQLIAGKDDTKKEAFYANDETIVFNKGKIAALKTIYRHSQEPDSFPSSTVHEGRIFASPFANSDDGTKPELTSDDKSWHPFFNKQYEDEQLKKINMPKADIGFGIASHYLLMAEGDRQIQVKLFLSGIDPTTQINPEDFIAFLTTEKDWLRKETVHIIRVDPDSPIYTLQVNLNGNDPAVTPYSPKVHGYNLDTTLPVLHFKLRQDPTRPYSYSKLENAIIQRIELLVNVTGLETLSVSNDFGPVDTSKPFQPFGPSPGNGQSLIIGSKEIFQKNIQHLQVNPKWQKITRPYGGDNDEIEPESSLNTAIAKKVMPGLDVIGDLVSHGLELFGRTIYVQPQFLYRNDWHSHGNGLALYAESFLFDENLSDPVLDSPDFNANEFYATSSRYGFLRLKLTSGFGQNQYQRDLLKFIKKEGGNPGAVPVGPTMQSISIDYSALQVIDLQNASSGSNKKDGLFFHFAPFGQPHQDPNQKGNNQLYLVPQFHFDKNDIRTPSEAEFYIGITGLVPPQTLSVFFQVADGTADPLTEKPKDHIHWSYLSGNQWVPFRETDVSDSTTALLKSGIITFTVPREASKENYLLPAGMHWIRAAVDQYSKAVCKLLMVAAQGFSATFDDHDNDPAFASKVLPPGTITKLLTPDASIKKIEQPFATFGGKSKETPSSFYTRVSERLRHKDRAVTLWDYEHLVLQNFPSIHRVKCLNHTAYEPTSSGIGIYKELAPGHVTIVTIPRHHDDGSPLPLKPYTSLGILEEIELFLGKRTTCFVKLHVKNPQFEEVRVSARVKFHEGIDETFFLRKLQESITRFLSPWAFTGTESPVFGKKIYKSSLIHFVEQQSYVDYVTDFAVYLDVNGIQGSIDLDIVEGTKAISALVSVASYKHQLTAIKPVEEEEIHETCICAS